MATTTAITVPLVEKAGVVPAHDESKKRFGKILLWLSILLISFQAIGLAVLASLAGGYTTTADKPLSDAFKALISLAGVSIGGRTVSAFLWFWDYKFKLSQKFYGKLILLATSVISGYAAVLSVGGGFVNATIFDQYKKIDKNIMLVYSLNILILIVSIFELLYSHIRPFKPGAVNKQKLTDLKVALLFAILATILFTGVLASQIITIFISSKIGSASVLSATDGVADLLQKAAKAVSSLNMASVVFTILLLLFYVIKSVAIWADAGFTGKVIFLSLSISSWLTTGMSYGATLPKLGILNVYRSVAVKELNLPSDVFVSINNILVLSALAFYLQFAALVLIHIISFMRARAAEGGGAKGAAPP